MITNISIHPEQNFFIVAQQDGVVHFKQLDPFRHVSYLNDSAWDSAFWELHCKFKHYPADYLNTHMHKTKAHRSKEQKQK